MYQKSIFLTFPGNIEKNCNGDYWNGMAAIPKNESVYIQKYTKLSFYVNNSDYPKFCEISYLKENVLKQFCLNQKQ